MPLMPVLTISFMTQAHKLLNPKEHMGTYM